MESYKLHSAVGGSYKIILPSEEEYRVVLRAVRHSFRSLMNDRKLGILGPAADSFIDMTLLAMVELENPRTGILIDLQPSKEVSYIPVPRLDDPNRYMQRG